MINHNLNDWLLVFCIVWPWDLPLESTRFDTGVTAVGSVWFLRGVVRCDHMQWVKWMIMSNAADQRANPMVKCHKTLVIDHSLCERSFNQIGCGASGSNWQLSLCQATLAQRGWCIGWLWSVCCHHLLLQNEVWIWRWKFKKLALDLMDCLQACAPAHDCVHLAMIRHSGSFLEPCPSSNLEQAVGGSSRGCRGSRSTPTLKTEDRDHWSRQGTPSVGWCPNKRCSLAFPRGAARTSQVFLCLGAQLIQPTFDSAFVQVLGNTKHQAVATAVLILQSCPLGDLLIPQHGALWFTHFNPHQLSKFNWQLWARGWSFLLWRGLAIVQDQQTASRITCGFARRQPNRVSKVPTFSESFSEPFSDPHQCANLDQATVRSSSNGQFIGEFKTFSNLEPCKVSSPEPCKFPNRNPFDITFQFTNFGSRRLHKLRQWWMVFKPNPSSVVQGACLLGSLDILQHCDLQILLLKDLHNFQQRVPQIPLQQLLHVFQLRQSWLLDPSCGSNHDIGKVPVLFQGLNPQICLDVAPLRTLQFFLHRFSVSLKGHWSLVIGHSGHSKALDPTVQTPGWLKPQWCCVPTNSPGNPPGDSPSPSVCCHIKRLRSILNSLDPSNLPSLGDRRITSIVPRNHPADLPGCSTTRNPTDSPSPVPGASPSSSSSVVVTSSGSKAFWIHQHKHKGNPNPGVTASHRFHLDIRLQTLQVFRLLGTPFRSLQFHHIGSHIPSHFGSPECWIHQIFQVLMIGIVLPLLQAINLQMSLLITPLGTLQILLHQFPVSSQVHRLASCHPNSMAQTQG